MADEWFGPDNKRAINRAGVRGSEVANHPYELPHFPYKLIIVPQTEATYGH